MVLSPAQQALLASPVQAQLLESCPAHNCSSSKTAAPAATAASSVATPAGSPSLGLQGRPPVPKLNLSTLSGGGAAPPPNLCSGKRTRLARASGLPAESSGSAVSARPGHLSARRTSNPRRAASLQQPAAAAATAAAAMVLPVQDGEAGSDSDADSAEAQPESKKSRALRRSPPRIIITSALFSYSAEKAKVGGVMAGGGGRERQGCLQTW